jgi:amino acid adenylation domain-containing protein
LELEPIGGAVHPDTLARLPGHLQTLVEAARIDPDAPVWTLPVLTRTETAQFDAWNSVSASYPGSCLHEVIAAQAARSPHATAVVGTDATLSYRELDHYANRIAWWLRSAGIGPEKTVAVCMDRTAALLASLLGVMKAGGAYVPLDPSYPPDRLSFMLEDAEASALIAHEHLLGLVPDAATEILCVDRDRSLLETLDSDPPPVEHRPSQLAYVIYTSGSTGRPKGVEVQHDTAVCFLSHMLTQPGLGPADVVLNLTTPAFDPSVMDFFWTLMAGATVVILDRDDTLDGGRLAEQLRSTASTFAWATPTTWRMVLDAGWEGSPKLSIGVAGERLPRELADALLARGRALWNLYGPTETTVYSSVLRLEPGPDDPRIGGPSPNERFYVVDSRLQPVPLGVPGQLLIAGQGVARGYRKRSDLTAEKFFPDPFRPDGGRVYATGDLVRYRADGTLEFLGRVDHQVKVRGFRVELGEIESVLADQPTVSRAVVVLREDVPGQKRLVAYVVPRDGGQCDVSGLREACSERLPTYMVPAAFVVLDALPTNPNRKVDRGALPPPDSSRPQLDRPFVAPESPLEELIAGTWEDVLRLEPVGLDDDFFELGGDSILATQVIARITQGVGVEVPLRAMFDGPTVRELARAALHAMSVAADVDGDGDGLVTSGEHLDAGGKQSAVEGARG